MKKRKGSTLALTLIIFAVLMIFGTFILSFMVTENKQAIYQQNKTQAYYIARTGAVAVEKAIFEMDNSELVLLEDAILDDGTEYPIQIVNPTLGDGSYSVKLRKSGRDYQDLEIVSTGKVMNADETVIKVLRKYNPSISLEFAMFGNEIYTKGMIKLKNGIIGTSQHEGSEKININDKKDLEIDYDQTIIYPVVKFADIPQEDVIIFNENESLNTKVLDQSIASNYVINEIDSFKDTKITISGNVNLYVKDKINITKAIELVEKKGSKGSSLNIFYYGKGDTFNINLDKKEKFVLKANIYIKESNLFIKGNHFELDGNIISNGLKIDITLLGNNMQHKSGSIYGPNATINISGDPYQMHNGAIISDKIIIESNNIHITKPSGGIEIPIDFTSTAYNRYVQGYFK